MKGKIGIWLDSNKALVIDDGEIETIFSEIEHFHLQGGARGKTPYGAQDATSETKLLERKKLQMKRYFEKLMGHVSNADKIVLFGPAETKLPFEKKLNGDPIAKEKLVGVKTVGNKLTDNQLVAWVKKFYQG